MGKTISQFGYTTGVNCVSTFVNQRTKLINIVSKLATSERDIRQKYANSIGMTLIMVIPTAELTKRQIRSTQIPLFYLTMLLLTTYLDIYRTVIKYR